MLSYKIEMKFDKMIILWMKLNLEKKTIGYVTEKYIKTQLKRDTVVFKKKSKKSAKNFSQAVISGKRSESGKVVLESF